VRDAGQVVLVTTKSWAATTGVLQRYERVGAAWKQVGAPFTVVVGAKGLGWGSADHPASDGPVKQEGDARTPAGIFRLTAAYGLPARPPKGTKLPYQRSSEATRCVDDGASPQYNQILEQTGKPTWGSAEIMRRKDGLYDWVMVVDHNRARTPGAGSCIFLHVWRDATSPTVGCTAMPKARLAELMAWIDPARAVLVVVPESLVPEFR
jgi:L,D-peptidoglycan transpeptidase YkuD (ErfK/YbiS/YcfS/YnhG family)